LTTVAISRVKTNRLYSRLTIRSPLPTVFVQPRMCPKSIWKRRPVDVTMMLSLCRSPGTEEEEEGEEDKEEEEEEEEKDEEEEED